MCEVPGSWFIRVTLPYLNKSAPVIHFRGLSDLDGEGKKGTFLWAKLSFICFVLHASRIETVCYKLLECTALCGLWLFRMPENITDAHHCLGFLEASGSNIL